MFDPSGSAHSSLSTGGTQHNGRLTNVCGAAPHQSPKFSNVSQLTVGELLEGDLSMRGQMGLSDRVCRVLYPFVLLIWGLCFSHLSSRANTDRGHCVIFARWCDNNSFAGHVHSC